MGMMKKGSKVYSGNDVALGNGSVISVNHGGEANLGAVVQLFQQGSDNLTNNTIDFDLADEEKFIQEDAENGTDFVDGVVRLHGNAGGSDTSIDFDAADEANYTQEDSSSGTDFADGAAKLHSSSSTTTSIVPSMTSNNVPSPFVITASSFQTDYGAFRAFDGIKNDIMNGWATDGVDSGIITIDLGTTHIVNSYSLSKRNNNYAEMPKNWTFEGSNNNNNWDVLDTHSDVTSWFAKETKTYQFNNSTSYRYYRLNVTANGGYGYLCICEINLYEDVSNYPTSQGYYIKSPQIDTSSKIGVTNVVITETTPDNTQNRYLVSIDGGTTYKAWDGDSWETVTLANIHTNGMSKTTLEGISNANWSTLFSAGTLDFAVGLKTTSASVTPEVSLITINFASEYVKDSDYYITTSNSNQIDTLNWEEINSITITQTEPDDTIIRYALSVDGRTTWKAYKSGAWNTVTLANLNTDGMTKTEFEALSATEYDSIIGSTLDFAIGLKTTDSTVTPSCSLISISYDEYGYYRNLLSTEIDSFPVKYLSNTIKVTNSSGSTAGVKVVVLT